MSRARAVPVWRRIVLAIIAILCSLSAGLPVWADAHYAVKAGDTLKIEVLEDPSLSRTELVLPDGTISFPYVGSFRVAGMTTDAIRLRVAKGIAPQFSIQPTVTVSVGALAPRSQAMPEAGGQVYLMGQIQKPGQMPIVRGETLLQAVAAAGGVTKFAADRRLELHRHDAASGKDIVYLFSITEAQPRGRPVVSPTTLLQPGDVIIVPAKRLFE